MDKELPWLADNAQLELKYKKGKTPNECINRLWIEEAYKGE